MPAQYHPEYYKYKDQIETFFTNFSNSGKNFVIGQRNSIKLFNIDGIDVSIKSFKKPNLINKIVYRYFRKSKARRSFEFASKLMDLGIDNTGIKSFLEENITEESMQLKGEELREYFENLEKEVRKIDIRSIKHHTGKKIMKAIDRVFKLISGCIKLNTENRNRELSREIEEINYGIGVISIS